MFVRKRSKSLELYPGVWTSSVGEHVFHGETVDETAKRALADFLGLNLPLSSLSAVHVHDQIENELMSVYTARGDTVPHLNPEHSEEGHFLSIEELLGVIERGESTPHLQEAVKLYVASLGLV